MPCGCFGGGGKKKGSPRGGSEAPPKPPKLYDEPIKEQQQIQQTVTPAYSSQQQGTEPQTPTQNGQLAHATANGATPTTGSPQNGPDTPSEAPSSTKSTGARSRAELYAKRREFFRPLYDVCLTSNSPNQKFMTPRAASTLPSRGKKGGFVIGDETGYFTAEGRFVPADGPSSLGANVEEGGEILSSDGASLEDSSLAMTDNQFMDVEGRIQPSTDRPPRPTSQPIAPAGQWDDTPDDERPTDLLQDEFHQKHHQIVQSQHSPSVPVPPPPPKEINPHFVEFQEKHQKIVLENESLAKDPKIAQKIVEKRLTELDKLHNEVKLNYEKRSKHGPIDVDSLVEKYTEERWRKMVDMWESEGLVVEGGMVVVDDQGNVVQREMKPQRDAQDQPFQKFSHVTESIGPSGETIVERIERDGDKITKTIQTKKMNVVESFEPVTESVVEKIENNGDRIVKIVETKKTVSDVGAAPSMSIFKDFKEHGDSELLSEILNAKGFGEPGTGTVVERIENDGDKIVKITETRNEIRDADDDDRISVVKNTETITVIENNSGGPSITTVITPPTPQAGVMVEEPILCSTNSDIAVEEIGGVPDHDFPELKSVEGFQVGTISSEPVINLPSDENLNQVQGVIEEEISSENGNFEVSEQILAKSSSFKDSPPPSPQTCTPPPSPTRDHQPLASAKDEPVSMDGSTSVCSDPSNPIQGGRAQGAVNATPPPSPPLGASAE